MKLKGIIITAILAFTATALSAQAPSGAPAQPRIAMPTYIPVMNETVEKTTFEYSVKGEEHLLLDKYVDYTVDYEGPRPVMIYDAESLNGTCDCNGLLIGDDLCSGIEEAQSPERLESLWQKVNNNLITRVKMGGKIWWIGTRWSLRDPIARRLNSLEGTNIRYRVHDTPALDEKTDESNFDFLFGVGFTTEYYRRRRLQFEQSDDNASWLAQYQQQPIERTGLLFPPDEMPTYNGVLPTDRPDKIFGHCDPAWGGGDYVVLPILIKFGDEYYCPDMVCDPSNKNVTIPKVEHKIADWGMTQVRFEKNNGGQEYKEAVDRELVKLNYKINTTCDYADNTKSKETRIFNFAPDIRKIHFLDPQKRTPEYQKPL